MSLQQANAILSAITTHQDWVCPNKTVINQLIEGNRQRISRLLVDATSFDQAVLEAVSYTHLRFYTTDRVPFEKRMQPLESKEAYLVEGTSLIRIRPAK